MDTEVIHILRDWHLTIKFLFNKGNHWIHGQILARLLQFSSNCQFVQVIRYHFLDFRQCQSCGFALWRVKGTTSGVQVWSFQIEVFYVFVLASDIPCRMVTIPCQWPVLFFTSPTFLWDQRDNKLNWFLRVKIPIEPARRPLNKTEFKLCFSGKEQTLDWNCILPKMSQIS